MRGLSNRIRKLENKRKQELEPNTFRTLKMFNNRGHPIQTVGIPKKAKIMIVKHFGESLEEWETAAIKQQEKLIAQHNKGETQ